MMRMRSFGCLLMAAIFAVMSEPSVLACAACFGKSDSNMAKGMNMGIFALLLVITTVLCGVAGFFVFLAKRSSEIESAQMSHTLSANETNA
jgi:hypothetical protein